MPMSWEPFNANLSCGLESGPGQVCGQPAEVAMAVKEPDGTLTGSWVAACPDHASNMIVGEMTRHGLELNRDGPAPLA